MYDDIKRADSALHPKPGSRNWREWHGQRRHLIRMVESAADILARELGCPYEYSTEYECEVRDDCGETMEEIHACWCRIIEDDANNRAMPEEE